MKRRLTWGALLLLTFLIFYIWMPTDMYLSMPILLGLIGGAICFFFMVQVIADFKDMDDVRAWDKRVGNQPSYRGLAFIAIPLAIVLSFVFAMHYSTLEDEELKKYGETVPATIVDGYYKSSSKSSTYKLTVSFYTKKGKHVRTQKEVTSSQYSDASKGQHVEVIYSSKHPSLIKILLGDDIVEEFTGIKSRKLTIDDMSKLLDMPGDSILPALNKINYRWIKADDDSSGYINENKQLYLSAEPHLRIIYVATGQNIYGLLGDLKSSGFKQDTTAGNDSEEKNIRLYTKDDIQLIVQTKAIEKSRDNGSRSPMAVAFNATEQALVLTMMKN